MLDKNYSQHQVLNFTVIEKKNSFRDGHALEGESQYQIIFKKCSYECDPYSSRENLDLCRVEREDDRVLTFEENLD